MKKPPLTGGFLSLSSNDSLLNFRFLELHVLLRNGVIFLLRHLFRHRAGVLLRDIEVPSVSGRDELDFDSDGFGHC